MLNEVSFLKLVEDNGGFEATLGFRNDVDHFIGGKDNKVWYFIQKGSNHDYYISTISNGEKKDIHYTKVKGTLKSEPAPAGKTMELILSELAIGQKEVESGNRKPTKVEVYGHPCSHYSFAFGERACKIADEFGITIEYSNLSDEAAGFRLRNICVGADVKMPKE